MNMKSLKKMDLVRRARQRGASGIEYALIATMVAVILVLFVQPINAAIRAVFQDIVNAF